MTARSDVTRIASAKDIHIVTKNHKVISIPLQIALMDVIKEVEVTSEILLSD